MNILNTNLPTFETAQTICLSYSTLGNNQTLQKKLEPYISPNYITSKSFHNIREIYNDILLNYYPNEACIKASFLNQILLNGKTHVTIFELPIGSSRADLCKINGKSIAYEIKTDLDNFQRLNKQLYDYNEIFEETYLICSENRLDEALRILPDFCGVYTYRKTTRGKYRFSLYRPAIFQSKPNTLKQLHLLRKSEHKYFKNVSSDSSDFENNVLLSYSPKDINRIFKQILKKRYEKQWSFFKSNHAKMLEIDYQWFFSTSTPPELIYGQN